MNYVLRKNINKKNYNYRSLIMITNFNQ